MITSFQWRVVMGALLAIGLLGTVGVGQAAAADSIKVRAWGSTGTETIELYVDDTFAGSRTLSRSASTWTVSRNVASKIEVRFVNNGYHNGNDKNAYINWVSVGNTQIEAEDPSVYSTGTWTRDTGCAGGYKTSQALHCNGGFTFTFGSVAPPPENCDWQTPVFTRNDKATGDGNGWIVRSQPRQADCTKTEMRVHDGERLLIKAEQGNWYYVQQIDENYRAGWVHKNGVNPDSTTPPPPPPPPPPENCDWQTPVFTRNDKATGDGNGWIVRSQPRQADCTKTEMRVHDGERLLIKAEQGNWYYVQQIDENYRAGWVHKNGVTPDSPPPPDCSLQVPGSLTFDEIILPARDNVVVRTQPRVDSCTDTGIRVDFEERMRVRATDNGWYFIDEILDERGNFARAASGWLHTSDLGTNEAVRVFWTDDGRESTDVEMTIRVDDTTNLVFFNQQFGWNAGGGGYFGFQQFPEGRKFIFSAFAATSGGEGAVLDYESTHECGEAPDERDIADPLRCLDFFNWSVGATYTLRMSKVQTVSGGARWHARILDSSGQIALDVGRFDIKTSNPTNHAVADVITFIEDFANGRDCRAPGSSSFHVAPPLYDGRASTYGSDSVSPCSAGSSQPSSRFGGGRELRFN